MQFLDLPSELISERVLNFLPSKWIVAVDSAVAVRAKRIEWLATMSRIHHFEKRTYAIHKYNLFEIRWLCERKIKFHQLHVNTNTSTEMLQYLLDSPTFRASRVTTLEILASHKLDVHIACRFLSLFTEVQQLYTCTQVAEIDRAVLSAAASKLKNLKISLGGPVSPLLDQHHPHLEELLIYNDLNRHTDSVVEYLQHSPNLSSLTTRGQGSDALLEALAIHCKNLHTLKLELSDGASKLVSDAGIKALAAGRLELQSVDFSKMKQLTEAAFIALAEGSTSITKLSVYMCTGITDRSLCAIGQHWPQLLELSVVNYAHITDSAIVAIAQGCPLLRECKLAACKLLTDTAVMALARHCTHLTVLSVSFCTLMTDDAIIYVLQHCTHFSELWAAHCKLLTAACLAPLEEQPDLVNGLKQLVVPANVSFANEGFAKIKERYPFVRFE